jgi:hypothetical protein
MCEMDYFLRGLKLERQREPATEDASDLFHVPSAKADEYCEAEAYEAQLMHPYNR